MTDQTIDNPKILAAIEMLSYVQAIDELGEDRHLKEREKQYVNMGIMMPGSIFIIRETEDGWWKEYHDMGKSEDKNKKMIQKFMDDPTVAYGWYTTMRFQDKGGWYDPS